MNEVGFNEVPRGAFKSLKNLKGFKFDWSNKSSDNAKTVVYAIDGSIIGLVEFERRPEALLNYMFLIEVLKEYSGTGIAGKLLAYVAMDSFEQGYDGFVLFESKTVLYEYYQVKYGAKPVKGRLLHFDTAASRKLIDDYLEANDERTDKK